MYVCMYIYVCDTTTFISRRSSSCSRTRVGRPFSGGCSPPVPMCKEEEDTCMSYAEEDTCTS